MRSARFVMLHCECATQFSSDAMGFRGRDTAVAVAGLCRAIAVILVLSISAVGNDEVPSVDAQLARVAVKAIPPFVYTDQASPTGFSIDLWNAIAATINVRTEYVVVQSVADILDAVDQGTADAGIAAVTINAEREARVDFSHPFYRSGLRIGAPARSGPTWASSFGRFLSADLLAMLLTLVGLTLIASHLLWFIERGVNPDCFPAGYFHGVGEAVWWSVATIITGGCENKAPVSLFGRLVAVAWMLGSIVLVASFTATLSSQMTAETVAGAITGPDDLPGRLVATVANTSAVPDLRKRNAKVRECQDLTTALKDVADGHADAVVFDAPVLAHAVNRDWNGRVRLIGPLFEQQNYGIVVSRGSPLRKAINQALLSLEEKGTLAELNEKWFGQRE
jgi:polar amino acid transport system substrate-binding protein